MGKQCKQCKVLRAEIERLKHMQESDEMLLRKYLVRIKAAECLALKQLNEIDLLQKQLIRAREWPTHWPFMTVKEATNITQTGED